MGDSAYFKAQAVNPEAVIAAHASSVLIPPNRSLVLRRGKGPRGIFEVIDSDEPRRHHQVKNFAVDGPTGTAHISSDSAASLKFGGRSNDQTHARYLCGACGYGSACHTCVRSRRDLIDTEFPWCVPSVPCRLHLWRASGHDQRDR